MLAGEPASAVTASAARLAASMASRVLPMPPDAKQSQEPAVWVRQQALDLRQFRTAADEGCGLQREIVRLCVRDGGMLIVGNRRWSS